MAWEDISRNLFRSEYLPKTQSSSQTWHYLAYFLACVGYLMEVHK